MCSVLQQQKGEESEGVDGKQGKKKTLGLTRVFPYSLALLLMPQALQLKGVTRLYFLHYFWIAPGGKKLQFILEAIFLFSNHAVKAKFSYSLNISAQMLPALRIIDCWVPLSANVYMLHQAYVCLENVTLWKISLLFFWVWPTAISLSFLITFQPASWIIISANPSLQL